jgi:hypothetical protein
VIAIHVTGPADGRSTTACFLRLAPRVVGGGRAIMCLKSFHGRPGPNSTVRIRATITFRLPHRTIRANVLIVDRFAADGKHATQRVTGNGISGGGRFVEDPPGHIRSSDLHYRVA